MHPGGHGHDAHVLHGVGDEQDHDEVERREPADLPSSIMPEPGEHGRVDDEAPPDDLDQLHRVPAPFMSGLVLPTGEQWGMQTGIGTGHGGR